ncbi:S-layer homology domain-containing protein [Aminipila sp.]|uniref:S-layer homology domain-containing protein n=1 Tax=Aminipila sp. TaxID=2060095 RepID=UPI002898EBF1|nr:S-layer homology domain-containing protein [Aminipila sp.]
MKKILNIVSFMLVAMMFASTAAFAATVPTDIAGTSCEEAVKTLTEAGAITGDTDGKFHPEDKLTRAQACIIIVKTIDPVASLVNGTATQSSGKTGFTDLKGYSWASGYIAYAVEHGIVKGYPDGTFKPGVNVSTNEMLTMVLRAAGYTEDKIGTVWPNDYITKAKEVGILKGIDESYPENATKGMASQMTFNQMKELRAMAPTITPDPQGTEKDKPSSIPSTSGMKFVTGSFDDNLNTFGGKTISGNIEIYTYGAKKDYSKDMKLSDKEDAYRKDTVYKFKDVKTPAWYLVENDKITKMILPVDTGFSGNVYGVVNGTIKVSSQDKEAITGFETLTATKAITWFGKKGLAVPTFTPGDGQLYELYTSNGEVRNVATTDGANGKMFKELTTGRSWTAVTEYGDSVITISSGFIPVKRNASIYIWDDSNKEYRAGSLSSIRAGKEVRAYDVSDDDSNEADVVIVK